MSDSYLLDNNAISILVRPGDPRYGHVNAQFDSVGEDATVARPVMAIAEIEYGMAKATTADPTQRAAVRAFFADHSWHLGFDRGTVEPYAIVRAKLWELYGTPKGSKKRGHQERLPDQLRDRETAQWIGVDERDLIIVSVALEYNLVFATVDRNEEMKRIEAAVDEVVSQGKWGRPLRLADWTPARKPTTPPPTPPPLV